MWLSSFVSSLRRGKRHVHPSRSCSVSSAILVTNVCEPDYEVISLRANRIEMFVGGPLLVFEEAILSHVCGARKIYIVCTQTHDRFQSMTIRCMSYTIPTTYFLMIQQLDVRDCGMFSYTTAWETSGTTTRPAEMRLTLYLRQSCSAAFWMKRKRPLFQSCLYSLLAHDDPYIQIISLFESESRIVSTSATY